MLDKEIIGKIIKFATPNSQPGGSFHGLRTNKNLRYSAHSRILVFNAPFVRIPNKNSSEKIRIIVESPEQKKHSGEMTNKY